MKIKCDVYRLLLQCPRVPPETGGILGGRNQVIDEVIFDQGLHRGLGTKYIPDADLLNRSIEKWNMVGIEFYGMFHTHAPQWPTLSGDDRKYITYIMETMPDRIRILFFPLVFPGQKVKWFRAEKMEMGICILKDTIKVV